MELRLPRHEAAQLAQGLWAFSQQCSCDGSLSAEQVGDQFSCSSTPSAAPPRSALAPASTEVAPRLPGIGSHHSARPQTDEWLTPPELLEPLGPFDLDPCAPTERPWPTAARHLTLEDDGLTLPWEGRVWLNPPYSDAGAWLERLAAHQHGTALVFARCETSWWFAHVWPSCSALLFLAGRVSFCRPDGSRPRAGHNSGGPSVLIAYGRADAAALAACGLPGALLPPPSVTR